MLWIDQENMAVIVVKDFSQNGSFALCDKEYYYTLQVRSTNIISGTGLKKTFISTAGLRI